MLTSTMIDKLNSTKETFAQLEVELANGQATVDKLKEYSRLAGIMASAQQYEKLTTDAIETKIWYNEETDPDIKDSLAEEYEQLKIAITTCEADLLTKLVEHDPNDDCAAIFEITGAVGGEEANLFARDLFEMYVHYATTAGFKVDLISFDGSERGGYNNVSFKIIGTNAYGTFKYESGIHRVQRVPETEARGRIHTSTATVMVTPEIESTKFKLNMDDVEITACHASGAGGQNINKVSSAIRAVYKPTGLTVFCQSRRDQPQNKEEALRIMASKLAAEQEMAEADSVRSAKASKLGTRDRSEKIRTYNYPQNRVTDHRINLSLLKLDRIMAGDMTELLTALKLFALEE